MSNLQSLLCVDQILHSGEKPSEHALVFIHGFPGLFTRNEDLATFASAFLGTDSFIPHLPGIGKSRGEFLFSSSIELTIKLIEEIIDSGKYKHVSLVGHSWGGFIALSAKRFLREKIHRTLLLSPFTIAPSVEQMLPDLKAFTLQQRLTGRSADLDRLSADMRSVIAYYHPKLEEGIDRTVSSVLVVQASQDTVMPATFNRKRFEYLTPSGMYVEVDDNHWFTNRPRIFEILRNFVGKDQ